MGGTHEPGRRERKKQATRAKLIDAAARLVEQQGYENTTIQQIAAAVDVSPRTVAHYFPNKGGLLLALVHAYADAVGAELRVVPMDVPPLEALLMANVNFIDRVTTAGAARIITLFTTLHVAPTVQPPSHAVRAPVLTEQMAQRMGVAADDRRVELVFAVWSALLSTAWSGAIEVYLCGEVDAAGLTALLRQRLLDAFKEFLDLCD